MDEFLIDGHKLHYHPERVAALVEAGSNWDKHRELRPIYAEISPTGACNHRCTFCSVDYIGYKPVFIDYAVLTNFFRSAESIGLKAVMFAGDGEPLLHPRISDIVESASACHIDTSFTTNGVHLTSDFVDKSLEKVTWIKVSMNAGDKDIYGSVHRTKSSDFDKVWSNLAYAIDKRSGSSFGNKDLGIGVQSLILPENLGSLRDLAARAKDTGLDYVVLKPYVHNVYMKQEGYQGIDYTKSQYLEELNKLKDEFDDSSFSVVSRLNALNKLVGNEERYHKCWSTPSLWFYISGNADVYACGAHVGKEEFRLGNINSNSIEEIWKSDYRKNCLNYVQNDLDLNTCRRTCRMDEPNKYLYALMEGDIRHKNFI